METNIDIYGRETNRRNIEAKFKNSNIGERNKEIVIEFLRYKTRESHISEGRRIKYLCNVRILAEKFGKPFDELTKQDINDFLDKLPTIQVYRGNTQKTMSKATAEDYCVQLKQILRFLKKEKGFPVEEEWVKVLHRYKARRLRPEEILKWEDVIRLSQSATNSRDQALVQVLFDSGARIGELLTLLIKDVEIIYNGSAAILNFRESKTQIRSPVIVKSAPSLVNWLRNHPRRTDKEAPLWVLMNKPMQPMTYNAARKVLRELQELSGAKKAINPHSFRKSSASELSSKGITTFQIKQRFGWTQSSRMLDVYVFPDEKITNDTLLEIEGVKILKKKEEEIKPQICNWCKTPNPVGDEYCVLCKRPLKEEKIMASINFADSISNNTKEFIEANPDLLNKFASFLEEKNKTEKCKS